MPNSRAPIGAGAAGPEPLFGTGAAIDSEDALAAALARLEALDPEIVRPMLAVTGRPPLRRREAGFEGLVQIIVSQQVSTASAAAIFGRLRFTVAPLEPRPVLEAGDATLRACGLSTQKIRALRSVAEAVLDGRLPLAELGSMPAEDAVRTLRGIRGIGPWTADIFLLFCLGHADAWPAGDLALQEAARLVLGLERRPDAKALHVIGERWRPYRAIAARLLWAYYRVRKDGREGIGLAAATERDRA